MFDEQEIERFLLGICEDVRASAIEEQLFRDDAFVDRVRQVKLSLFERYAGNALPADLRGELEAQAKRSPQLHAELQEALTRTNRTPWFRRWYATAAEWPPVWQFAAVALVVATILTGATVLLRHDDAPDAQIKVASHVATTKPVPAPATIFVPMLVLRGTSNVPAFQLAQAPTAIEIQLEVHAASDRSAGWSASLSRHSEVLFHQDHLTEQTEGRIHYVSLAVPAGVLSGGDYQVLLSAPGQAPSIRAFRILTFAR